MELTPSSLKGLFTTYNRRFMNVFNSTSPIWPSLAMKETSSTSETTYPMSSVRAKLREWKGERILENVRSLAYTIGNGKYEWTLELDIDHLADDQFGLYNRSVDEGAIAAKLHPDELVIQALLEGTANLCVDGVAFFSDVHPVDPTDDSITATYTNLYTGKPLNTANFEEVYTAARLYKGWNGRILKNRMDTIVVPPQLEVTARRIVENSDTVVSVVGTGLTVLPNDYKGWAKVVVLEELADYPLDWYLLKANGPSKPIIFQERVAPKYESITGENTELVMFNRKVIHGVFARSGYGYYLPQFAVKCEG